MKKILCYGDSNTWGQAAFGGRIDDEKQWPTILQALLSNKYKVIQEGLSARVAGDFETRKPQLNGKASFEVILRSTEPEVIIIALGTNDLKTHYGRTAQQITNDLLWYADFTNKLVKTYGWPAPDVVYLLPPNFVSSDYYSANEQTRQELIKLVKQTGQDYIELPRLTMTEDGVHYTLESHRKVANTVFDYIKGETNED